VVRGGLLIGTRHYPFDDTLVPDTKILEAFVRQHYERTPFVPPEILMPVPLESQSMIGDWLSGIANRKVRMRWPQRGRKVTLVKMANRNAEIELKKRTSQQAADMALLVELKKSLRLPRIPERIECFDNSNLSGTNPVAGMVVFVRARPFKTDYRKYRLDPAAGSDDYAAMAEVLTRRFRSDSAPETLPDLLVIDGGKGQLNVAMAVLKQLGLANRLNAIGLAKKDRQGPARPGQRGQGRIRGQNLFTRTGQSGTHDPSPPGVAVAGTHSQRSPPVCHYLSTSAANQKSGCFCSRRDSGHRP